MLYPAGEPTYATFPVCSTDGTHAVTLLSFTAGKLTGLDDVEFRAAWLGPSERLRIGAGRLSQLEEPFGAAPGSTGQVRACGERDSLTIAVLLPDAASTAAVVDGVTFRYQIDGTTYTGHADVTFGVCASDPAHPENEPEECQPSTG